MEWGICSRGRSVVPRNGVRIRGEGAGKTRHRATRGYDFVRYNANPMISGAPPSESFNANGLSGQVAYNPLNRPGLVTEVSGYALSRHGLAATHQIS